MVHQMFVKVIWICAPTNTTQTAANIPLVMGLGSIKNNSVTGGVYWYYWF